MGAAIPTASIGLDPGGRPHISYAARGERWDTIRHAEIVDGAWAVETVLRWRDWTDPRTVPNDDGLIPWKDVPETALVVDRKGTVHIAYGNPGVFVAERIDGTWRTSSVAPSFGGDLSATIDAYGDPAFGFVVLGGLEGGLYVVRALPADGIDHDCDGRTY